MESIILNLKNCPDIECEVYLGYIYTFEKKFLNYKQGYQIAKKNSE